METYGVSFDGFQPSCGWPMYKHIESEFIPHLKREVVRWRERRDAAAKERAALKGLQADLEGMMKSRDGLVAKLQAKIPGSKTKVNDVMPLGVKEAEVETSSTWQELSSWLDESKTTIEQIAFFYKHACKRADMSLGLFENFLGFLIRFNNKDRVNLTCYGYCSNCVCGILLLSIFIFCLLQL